MLTARSFSTEYYIEHRDSGLDYLGFGEWQLGYGRWLASCLGWRGRKVLDVGCACGSILRGMGEAGIIVQGVDINEHMILLGKMKWPDMTPLLHVCDAINLHLWAAGDWQGIHCAQVAEHWRPQHVPFIMDELRRVCSPGSLWFCSLDTTELYARQNRDPQHPDEDPTHTCLKPMSWWLDQLPQHGWKDASGKYRERLTNEVGSYLKIHDWDWFVAEACP